jgi:predicted  nucleic acid-binding Zn-ribbon protein
MSQTLSLYRLQQADSQIDRAKARLQVIQRMLNDDDKLRLVIERVDSTKATCLTADRSLKQAETDAQSQRNKIEQTEASLYRGKNHSPKELLDLQNDLSSLKRYLGTLEDIQLDAMQIAEESISTHQFAHAELLAAQAHSEEQHRGLNEEQDTLLKELEKLFAERAAVAGPIPPDLIGLYDQLRQQRRGLAVAVISENSCSACGSGLSAALMQSSRASGKIALCPSCGRILYGS